MSSTPAQPTGGHAPARATEPETRGIELVEGEARHGRPRDLFWVWAAPNVGVLNLTIGASLVLMGLSLWQTFAAILVGNLVWVLPGIVAMSGPSAGTSGSVIGRAMYGIIGNRLLLAFSAVIVASAYLALNWLASSFVGANYLASLGLDAPVWGPILVALCVSAVTVAIAVYGHAMILRIYPILTLALAAVFLVVVVLISPSFDWHYEQPTPLSGMQLVAVFTIGATIQAATPLSFTNSADLARYLPRNASRGGIIAATALGGALPSVLFTSAGALMATGLDASVWVTGIEGALLQLVPGWFAPVLVLAVVMGAVALNSITTYTSSMALQAIGVPVARIPAAIIIGLFGTAITVYLTLSSSLLEAVNLMLQFLLIVSVPAMSIYVTDIVLRRVRYDEVDLFDERPGARLWYWHGWSVAGIVATLVGGGITALSISTTIYVGPIAQALGGADFSIMLGGVASALCYTLLFRRAQKR
ncbi:purine-cytosine permease family protein [Leucobacter chinensis]|uniref:purine-cytosine permease family protein n=1 Tax=Leucobacter chinensis TaxID=2851010 RepID=UPI001C22F796|nr:cytosine permease [Leucobacter chinensis]